MPWVVPHTGKRGSDALDDGNTVLKDAFEIAGITDNGLENKTEELKKFVNGIDVNSDEFKSIAALPWHEISLRGFTPLVLRMPWHDTPRGVTAPPPANLVPPSLTPQNNWSSLVSPNASRPVSPMVGNFFRQYHIATGSSVPPMAVITNDDVDPESHPIKNISTFPRSAQPATGRPINQPDNAAYFKAIA